MLPVPSSFASPPVIVRFALTVMSSAAPPVLSRMILPPSLLTIA